MLGLGRISKSGTGRGKKRRVLMALGFCLGLGVGVFGGIGPRTNGFSGIGSGVGGMICCRAEVRVIRTDSAAKEQLQEQERMRQEERKREEAAKRMFLPAGTAVKQTDIDKYGLSAYFTSSEISDAVFARMEGKSFGKDCTVPREDLRYIKVLYCSPDKQSRVGEMVCNKAISQELLEIFQELYEQNYLIEKMVLVDEYGADDLRSAADNNTSCFNFRLACGPSGNLSYHAQGLAVDINPLYNPYLWTDSEGEMHCEPEEGLDYADREGDIPYKIEEGDLCCRLFLEHGFSWGGNWNYEKDYMHFSKRID